MKYAINSLLSVASTPGREPTVNLPGEFYGSEEERPLILV